MLAENGDMPSDTHTEASDATTPGPELRNGQLVVLMAREQPPDVQAELKVRVGSLKIRPSSFDQRVSETSIAWTAQSQVQTSSLELCQPIDIDPMRIDNHGVTRELGENSRDASALVFVLTLG